MTNVTIEKPPVLMLIDGWYALNRLHSDLKLSTLCRHQNTSAHSPLKKVINLGDLFQEEVHAILSKQLQEKARKILDEHSTIKREAYSHRRIFDENMKLILEKHPEAFFRIANHKKLDDKIDWKGYLTPDGKLNHEAINALPRIEATDHIGGTRMCQVRASRNEIFLPIGASELFNAMALIRGQSCVVEFSMPSQDVEQGSLSIQSATALKQKSKTIQMS